MDLELQGKRALVTGGSRGIGKAVALALALEGADVAILARDPARLEAAAKELREASGRTVVAASQVLLSVSSGAVRSNVKARRLRIGQRELRR